jgi:transcriptional accessory protein Tex/SPT6
MRRHFNNLLQCFFVSVSPMIIRRVRANLNREAEKAALDVFLENLQNLLLTPPCKGTTVYTRV